MATATMASVGLMVIGVVLVALAILWIMGPVSRFERWAPWAALATGFLSILGGVWLLR